MTGVATLPAAPVESLREGDGSLCAYGEPARPGWREVDWRSSTGTVRVSTGPVVCMRAGDAGPPVVLVHGSAGSWQWWLETIPALALDHRVVAIDLPGYGLSPRAPGPVTVGTLARTVEEVCDALDLGAVSIFGHSMGTLVAPRVAALNPDRVERIVLAGGPILSVVRLLDDPVGTARRHPRILSFLVEAATTGTPLPKAVRRLVAARPALRRIGFQPYIPHPERIPPDIAYELLGGVGRPGVLRGLRGLRDADTRDYAAGVDCPVLLVNGLSDRLVPPDDAHEVAARLANPRLVFMDDTGHWPMIERAATFNERVRSFLDDD